MDVESMEDEAVAGEYYIDSLAVAPTQRGKGVGAASLPKPWRKPRNSDCALPCWSIPTTPAARRLYEAGGFRESGAVTAFGQTYLRMQA